MSLSTSSNTNLAEFFKSLSYIKLRVGSLIAHYLSFINAPKSKIVAFARVKLCTRTFVYNFEKNAVEVQAEFKKKLVRKLYEIYHHLPQLNYFIRYFWSLHNVPVKYTFV